MSLKDDIKARVKDFVDMEFEGNYRVAFDYYDSDKDGKVTKDELVILLSEVGIGNMLTRNIYAKEGIKALDLDHDGGVSWSEFQTALVTP